MAQSPLPALDSQRQAHQQTMLAHLKQLIGREGPITFKEYMNQVLYAPSIGYYRSRLPILGRSGDFTTAPELSSLFSRALALQCAQILSSIPRGTILEIGAGRGHMAADILLELEKRHTLPERYEIIELSASLKQIQAKTLSERAPHLLERVHWLDQWPPSIRGVVIANEVLDAMPVHLFHYQAQNFQEYYVDWRENKLHWQLGTPSSKQLAQQLSQLEPYLCEDYVSEINCEIKPWLQGLANSFQQGLVLLIDYGFPRHEYYHPQRSMGTLMCHFHHRYHDDPLALPGIQDITAHVDFTAAAEGLMDCGLDVTGFCNQGDFLINCGLTELVSSQADPQSQYETCQQIRMLTLPSEMGELFKVLGGAKDLELECSGFEENDQRRRLG